MTAEAILSRLEGVRNAGEKKWHARCPAHHDKKPSLIISERPDGSTGVHCFAGCETVDVIAAVGLEWSDLYLPTYGERGPFVRPVIEAPITKKRREILSDYGNQLWRETVALAGTVGERYLRARNCVTPPADSDLRFHPRLTNKKDGHTGPALVGLVTDAITNEPISLHRTWITETGKAEIPTPRMLLGGHRSDGVIRLYPNEDVTTGLAIAEGIETALSLAWGFTPVWSVIDAGNMAKFPVLLGIESLLIARDNDPAGIKAAKVCADRWSERAEVRITYQEENDINEVVA